MEPLKIYRKKELCNLLGVSISTLYRWMNAGSFPTPVRVSQNIVGWLSEDIEAWRGSLNGNDHAE
jgi:prophage regulatory protein